VILPWIGDVAAALLGLYAAACLWFALRSHRPRPFLLMEVGKDRSFPSEFLWGTATAAHQVEGGNDKNDWSVFEQQPGRIARGERSGRAVDHWNRVGEDIGLMERLGANAYRFSIEWSRLENSDGNWDDPAWAHYQDEVRQLLAAGIQPMVTLHHFTFPRWLGGGVLDPGLPERFGRFAKEAARRLPEVTLWCTINEPNVLLFNGFVDGIWPPAVKDPVKASAAFAGLLRAHASASAGVRAVIPQARIGVAMHLRAFDVLRAWFLPDWMAASSAAKAFNWAFYDSILSGRIRFAPPGFPRLDEAVPGLRGSADWFGVNYYTRDLVGFSPGKPGQVTLAVGPGPTNALGWEIYPEGLLQLLRAAHARYRLPLYVTENGVDDRGGTLRPLFILGHLRAVARATREGIPVLGYFHWSLMDNFEWTDGFAPRFGLYRVDYPSLDRSPASGAETFAALADEVRRGHLSRS
jgi:beta-glucosidase